ncbi:integrase [Herbidospora sp. RD11066]
MNVTMVSAPARTDRVNEDFTGAIPAAAVLIDGAGIPGAESTCRHGVAWYARRLGGTLLGLLSLPQSLPGILAEAITQVTDAHRDTCDVTNPISPSAAVAILRVSGDHLDHLVLGDALVLLDRTGAPPLVSTDPREVTVSRTYEPLLEATTPGGDEHHRILHALRANRNRTGGFWVAKDDPRAAEEAITGRYPVADLSAAALLSNGAGRIVDRFDLTDWPGVLAALASNGPGDIIDRVRQAEAHHSIRPDDATIAYCTNFSTHQQAL